MAATVLTIASIVVAVAAVVVASRQADIMRHQTVLMQDQRDIARDEAALLAVETSLVSSQTAYMERQLALQSSEMQPVFEVSLETGTLEGDEAQPWHLIVNNVGSPVLAVSATVFSVSELTVGAYTAENPSIPVAWQGYYFDTSLYSSEGAALGVVADFEDESDPVYAAIREWNDMHEGDDLWVIHPLHYVAISYRDIASGNHLVVYEVPPMGGRPTMMNTNTADEVLTAYQGLIDNDQVLSWGVNPEDLATMYATGSVREWAIQY